MDEASKANLSDEFGTADEEEVMKKILQSGSPQVGVVSSPPITSVSRVMFADMMGYCRRASARETPTSARVLRSPIKEGDRS
jgi:hypothetical protein